MDYSWDYLSAKLEDYDYVTLNKKSCWYMIQPAKDYDQKCILVTRIDDNKKHKYMTVKPDGSIREWGEG